MSLQWQCTATSRASLYNADFRLQSRQASQQLPSPMICQLPLLLGKPKMYIVENLDLVLPPPGLLFASKIEITHGLNLRNCYSATCSTFLPSPARLFSFSASCRQCLQTLSLLNPSPFIQSAITQKEEFCIQLVTDSPPFPGLGPGTFICVLHAAKI